MKITKDNESEQLYREFLDGFAIKTGVADPEEQWAYFSRNLTDSERHGIELGGYAAGEKEGTKFNKLYV